jgi:hypothetical protein
VVPDYLLALAATGIQESLVGVYDQIVSVDDKDVLMHIGE